MAKKADTSYKPLLMAACFTILAVGIYAHVDSWLVRKELTPTVLGWETKKQTTVASILEKVWGRLKYGSGFESKSESAEVTATETELPAEVMLERELKNLEREMQSDPGEDATSSYWSM